MKSKKFKLIEKNIKVGLKEPIRILHISDLHFYNKVSGLSDFIVNLVNLNPDIVINTGDNLSGAKGIKLITKYLEPLFKFNNFFVFGGNDYYNRTKPVNPAKYFFQKHKNILEKQNMPTEKMRQIFLKNKCIDLNNNYKTIKIKNSNILLTGLNDPHMSLDNLKMPPFNNIKNANLKIGVVHAPYTNAISELSFNDIIFSGHTHGGQWCLPGSKALVVNCDIKTKFAQGLFKVSDILKYSKQNTINKNCLINISNGLGTSRFFNFRVFCDPSATLITVF